MATSGWLSIDEITQALGEEVGRDPSILKTDLERWFSQFVNQPPPERTRPYTYKDEIENTNRLMGLIGSRYLAKTVFEKYCSERGLAKPRFWIAEARPDEPNHTVSSQDIAKLTKSQSGDKRWKEVPRREYNRMSAALNQDESDSQEAELADAFDPKFEIGQKNRAIERTISPPSEVRNFILRLLQRVIFWPIALAHTLVVSEKDDRRNRVPYPFCSEMIQKAAIVCPFCQKDLESKFQTPARGSQPEAPSASAISAGKTFKASGQRALERNTICPEFGSSSPIRDGMRPIHASIFVVITAGIIWWIWASSGTPSAPESPPEIQTSTFKTLETAANSTTISYLSPWVQNFLNKHPEFSGLEHEVKNLPDSSFGKRQQVQFGTRTYIFYENDGEVVTVYQIDEEIEMVWRKLDYEPSGVFEEKNGGREDIEVLPEYELLNAIRQGLCCGSRAVWESSGYAYGDVLVESMSRATPVQVREKTLRKISKKEGFSSASLYCSREAMKAAFSNPFRDAQQDVSNCSLGYLGPDGNFIE